MSFQIVLISEAHWISVSIFNIIRKLIVNMYVLQFAAKKDLSFEEALWESRSDFKVNRNVGYLRYLVGALTLDGRCCGAAGVAERKRGGGFLFCHRHKAAPPPPVNTQRPPPPPLSSPERKRQQSKEPCWRVLLCCVWNEKKEGRLVAITAVLRFQTSYISPCAEGSKKRQLFKVLSSWSNWF